MGKSVKQELRDLDIGFRVLKLDSSNVSDEFTKKGALVHEVKPGRTAEDLLFEVMLNLGVLLDGKIERRMIGGNKVFLVNDNYIAACFDKSIAESTLMAIAEMKPQYLATLEGLPAPDDIERVFDEHSKDTKWVTI